MLLCAHDHLNGQLQGSVTLHGAAVVLAPKMWELARFAAGANTLPLDSSELHAGPTKCALPPPLQRRQPYVYDALVHDVSPTG